MGKTKEDPIFLHLVAWDVQLTSESENAAYLNVFI